jgi:sterol desaturase/sphingolipid hydroxylase (fatty acid hydroxylase superfamily)
VLESASFPRLYWNVALIAFFGLALCESFRPRHARVHPIGRRWLQHGALAVAGSVLGLIVRTSPLVVAGAFANAPVALASVALLPTWLRIGLAFVVLDGTRYLQHRLMHAVPVLWRLHQVHHSDEDFDLTTGLRFHPIEAVLTQGSYLVVVAAMAAPVEAVLLAELATIAQNFFAHANLRLPGRVERLLRRVVVTPELHRVHHSVDLAEQNTNFSSLFPFWDRLGGTYRDGPAEDRPLVFGLRELAPGTPLTLGRLLRMPFAGRNR